MKCEEARVHLESALLGLLSEAETQAVEAHRRQCPACAQEALKGRQIATLAREALAVAAAPPDIPDRIRKRLAAERVRVRRQYARSRLFLWAFRVAALALAAVLIYTSLRILRPTRSAPYSVRVAWRRSGFLPLPSPGYPVVAGSYLIMGERATEGDRVTAVCKTTGKPIWSVNVGPIRAIRADDERVVVCTQLASGCLHVRLLRRADGKELWRAEIDQPPAGGIRSALSLGRTGLAWAVEHQIRLHDVESGTLRWASPWPGRQPALAWMSSGELLVTDGFRLEVLDPEHGHSRWCQNLGEGKVNVVQPPFVECAGTRIYLVRAVARPDAEGELLCLEADTGALRWRTPCTVPLGLSVCFSFVLVRAKGLEVFHADSGTPLWSASLLGCAPASGDAQQIYVVGGRGKRELLALDASTGRAVWTYHLASSCSGLVVEKETGYLCGHDGRLYAVVLGRRG